MLPANANVLISGRKVMKVDDSHFLVQDTLALWLKVTDYDAHLARVFNKHF